VLKLRKCLTPFASRAKHYCGYTMLVCAVVILIPIVDATRFVSYPRIPGHEISATVVEIDESHNGFAVGSSVTLSPYTNCGVCASCRNNRSNACEFNQTLGVQRDGALTEYISVPVRKLYRADLSQKELSLVEPLTVGCHAVARARVAPTDTVAIFGCGGVGLGAVAASAFRGATTIAIDIDDAKLDIAKKAGALLVINSRQQEPRPSDQGTDRRIWASGRD
jgi:threonine dehydrogenase-like Zn-dependent dehydrogenase